MEGKFLDFVVIQLIEIDPSLLPRNFRKFHLIPILWEENWPGENLHGKNYRFINKEELKRCF